MTKELDFNKPMRTCVGKSTVTVCHLFNDGGRVLVSWLDFNGDIKEEVITKKGTVIDEYSNDILVENIPQLVTLPDAWVTYDIAGFCASPRLWTDKPSIDESYTYIVHIPGRPIEIEEG